MRKVLIIVGILVVIVIGVVVIMVIRGPSLKEFEYLKEPAISSKPDQKMIVIEAKGDPNVVGKEVFNKLFGTFFKLKGSVKGMKVSAPRARWLNFKKSKNEWIGVYGLPVPDSVTELPQQKDDKGLKVEIDVWKYGQVAEILHIGPYSEEAPTIEKLIEFIEKSGYKIIGAHEEEYLKGPGLLPRNPKSYYTIIRYNVKKRR